MSASASNAANGYPQYPPTIAQPVPQQQPQQQPYVPQQPQLPQQQQQLHNAPRPTRSAGSDGRHTANLNGGGSVETAATPHEMSNWATCEFQRRTLTLQVPTRFSTKQLLRLHSAQRQRAQSWRMVKYR